MIQLFGFSFRKAFCKTVTENFVLEAAATAAVTSSATTAAASATIVRFGFRYYGRMGIQVSVIAANSESRPAIPAAPKLKALDGS